MNGKSILITLLASTLVTAPAFAGRYDDRDGRRSYARVVEVQPVIKLVETTTPRRECWEEQVLRRESRHASPVPAIVGGLIGGAIGHNLGHGRGRGLATVAGTIIGASVADDAAHAHEHGGYYTDNQRHCRVSHETVTEERILGYDVTYRYRGETYTTRMNRDPGDRLAVRVRVEPIE